MIIDANIIKGYYEEDVLGIESDLTASPLSIINKIPFECHIYVDEGEQIENEWKSLVSKEWFDGWYSSMLIEGKIQIIPATQNPNLAKKLYSMGFPKNRDIWYIRIAETVSSQKGRCILLSEDIHFYDPKKGSLAGDARISVLRSNSAPVRKLLRKMISTFVSPVVDFNVIKDKLN